MRSHPFFKGIDFVRLVRKEVAPPHVPTIGHPEDVSNFDPYDDEDEHKQFDGVVRTIHLPHAHSCTHSARARATHMAHSAGTGTARGA